MGIIMAPLIDSMVSALNAQAKQVNVVASQEQARLAMERMRKDIHCAHSVSAATLNDDGGYTVLLTETNVTGVAECPGLLSLNASAVQWCTIPVAGGTGRYRLYREDDPDKNCDGVDSTFQVDYITQANLWSLPTCTGGQYPTLNVVLPVAIASGSKLVGNYDLQDQIALRNADPCT